jgi:hypothetical protein
VRANTMCAPLGGPRGAEMTTHNLKLLQQLERERADRLALRLTLQQLDAIAKDTRLPGEIAGTYGVTAAVILQIQRKARASAARRRLR